jgi:hypothetical protein
MNLSISKSASNKVSNAILISGSARSGTTLIGKVIHSLKNVEYSFEPATLFSLIPLINSINKNEWKLLYETYLYEDFFINALGGRSVNCNTIDDSSIYKVKSRDDIEARLNRSIGKVEAEKNGRNGVIAYKMPDIVPFIPKMIEYYPNMRVVIMERGPIETINSLFAKKWFSERVGNRNTIWPFSVQNKIKTPFWVCDKDIDLWCSMNEIDRCAYYYIQVNSRMQNSINLQYESFIKNPYESVSNLAADLGLEFGDKTCDIINSVKLSARVRDNDILEKISFELRQKVIELSNSLPSS